MGGKSKTLGLMLMVVIIVSVIVALVIVNPRATIDNNTFTAPSDDNAVITIQSPQDGAIYNVTSVPLCFTVQNNYDIFFVRYILNNSKSVTIPRWIINQTALKGYFSTYNYTYFYPRFTAESNMVLPDLTNGNYNLTIENFYYASTGIQVTNSTSINFTVDTACKNATTIFQPQKEPYPKLTIISFDSPTKNVATDGSSSAAVDVTFNLTTIPSWVGYSIDGKRNQTIFDLSSIYGIQTPISVPLGSHTVTFYTNNTAGNWATPVTFYSTVISFKDYVAGKTATNSFVPPTT